METKTYKLACDWHGTTTYVEAVSVSAALQAYSAARGGLKGFNVVETWEADGEASPAGGFASFTGQEWPNGDFNFETVTAEETVATLAVRWVPAFSA